MSNFGDLGEALRDLEKVLHAKPPLRTKRVNVGMGHKASHAARGSRISTLVASISSMAEKMMDGNIEAVPGSHEQLGAFTS